MSGPPTGATDPFVDRTTERTSLGEALRSIVLHRELLKNLVMRDLKLKYRGSVLGFLWSLANPLAMVSVYTLAFKYILGNTQPGYPFFLLLGVLAWTFFANAATMSTGVIVDGGGLIRAVRFPRAILPLATVFFNLAQYLLTVLAFLPVMLGVLQVPPAWPMLMFPLVLALQVVFTVGVALLLSAATAHFRDVRHLVEVVLPMLFWTTPVIYALSAVPAWLRPLVRFSPVSPFIVAYQRIFYEGGWPDVSMWLVAGAYSAGMLAIGARVFQSLERDLADRL